MRIGDLAKRSGLTTATIRFYERQGLLPPPSRADNGYRDYTVTDLERAVTFAGFRDLGLEPPEAARLADQCATGRCDVTFAELTPDPRRPSRRDRDTRRRDACPGRSTGGAPADHRLDWPVGPIPRIQRKGGLDALL